MTASIAGFELVQLLLVSAVVVLAAVLRGFTGFGFALVAVPVFSLIMLPTEAVVLSALLTLTISLFGIRSYWGVVPLKPMWPLVLMALVGTVVGTWVITRISASSFQLWAGLSIILACLGMTSFRPLQRPLHPVFAWLTGLLSGLMNGALAIPGPPMVIYAMLQEPQPHRSRALLMTFFLAASLLALASFALAGFFNIRSAGYFLASIPALYVGDRFGTYLFRRFGSVLYRRIALVGLLSMGLGIVIGPLL